MEKKVWENQTMVTEFILLGFGGNPELQIFLFMIVLIIYMVTMVGNILIVALVVADQHLHTPMYYFLGNLSCLETFYSSTILPKMLASFVTGNRSISFIGCFLQMYFFGSLAATECFLLSAMSYDRYLAICKPLHYTTLMNNRDCLHLIIGSWISGFLGNSVLFPLLQLTFCGRNDIDHFFCDFNPLLKLACSDIHKIKMISPKPTNLTGVTEFVLLGLTDHPDVQVLLFIVFLLVYIVIIVGNMLIFFLIIVDPTLHTPMYFFLKVLSFLDVCYSSVALPKMLVNFLSEDKRISYIGCAAQMFFLLFLGASECFLLAAMAYDRYVAICKPLMYMAIMNEKVCLSLTVLSWFLGNLASLLQTVWVFSLPFCGSNQINYFFCDIPPLIKLSCIDTSSYEMQLFTATILVILTPFSLVLVSYILIISSILKMTTVEGRQKAFSTCSSHLLVVTLYYGSGSLIYLKPKSIYSQDSNKVLALMYTAITPILNPIIYSLRNKEISEAMKRMLCREDLILFLENC
uniref:olfactory receptor 10A7-like n=1 Tax=Euleptes europaea TaxID=460621 RepID=UPI00254136D1|nr:olfactory receptor 10A7-like [Euleptes europaea]